MFNVNFLTFGRSLSSTRKPRGRGRRIALILYVPLRKPHPHFTPLRNFAMSAHLTLPLLQKRIVQGKLVDFTSLVEVEKTTKTQPELIHCKPTPQHFIRHPWQYTGTHLHSWVETGTKRVKFKPKTWTSRPSPAHWTWVFAPPSSVHSWSVSFHLI